MNSTTKTCKDCGLEKPLILFYAAQRTRDGRASYCKDCHTLRNESGRLRRQERAQAERGAKAAQLMAAGLIECKRCSRTKPLDGFYPTSHTSTGYRGVCKECVKAARALKRGPVIPLKSAEERLWERIERRGPAECWPWTGNKSMAFWINGETINARRALFELAGVEIPQDQRVMDTCANPLCMNRAHLVLKPKGNGLRHEKKLCSRCGLAKPLSEFSPSAAGAGGRFNYCKPCARDRMRERYRKTPSAVRASTLAKYGLTLEDFTAMLEEQDGKCAICGGPGGIHGLVVDHDHLSGMVRQALCSSCNTGIAMFGDDPERMRAGIAYLTKWAAIIASDDAGATSARSQVG